MSLHYSLHENQLTPNPDDYAAQVQDVKSYDLESVISRMTQRGTTLTKTDCKAVVEMLFDEVARITEEGGMVNMPLFNTRFSISGTFQGITDSFDSSRHAIKVNVNAAKQLLEAIRKVRAEKVHTKELLPIILQVKDSISQSNNENITSGGVIEILGSMLKVDGDKEQVGIYFIDEKNAAHKVQTLIDNKPGRIIAMVPKLTKGLYQLQINTQHSGGGHYLKSIKTATFSKPLHVL